MYVMHPSTIIIFYQFSSILLLQISVSSFPYRLQLGMMTTHVYIRQAVAILTAAKFYALRICGISSILLFDPAYAL